MIKDDDKNKAEEVKLLEDIERAHPEVKLIADIGAAHSEVSQLIIPDGVNEVIEPEEES